jgi:ABC-type phosphate transport system substrate-binding protein
VAKRQNNEYVMTYVERSNTYKRRLPLANMINKAGNNITLNATAAKSAMEDYSAVVRSGMATHFSTILSAECFGFC